MTGNESLAVQFTGDQLVVTEHPARPDWKLAASLKPEESTAMVHRFRVTVPPGQTTSEERQRRT